MNPLYEKLKNLLKELFQLNEPDLDFGLYRIMRAKSAEVTKFLDEELLPQVQEAFSRYRSADKEETEQELHRAIEQATALGLDPEATPKVKELREKLKATSDDGAALESEVYDHLYSFFRRYYAEGDFLSKRVYKPGVYAIPYEGEEVKLYWANYDQYYIKTSEYLREYSFRLNPGNEANPMRVHFRLVDATEGEHGNIKEQEGKKRRFKLAQVHPVVIEHGELVVRFTFEPQPKEQKELNAAAERTILSMTDPALAPWLELLQKPHKRSDGTVSDSTRLRVHLDRYTARNTFDYFIHKDLGAFLRRELDFYIKNEVMHLDDIEQESAPRVEQYLSKIKVIRSIAGKIIDFLAQLEDFQKKLWLKKKFVTETSWCIRVGIIPEEFYPEIARTSAQWDEWNTLHHFESEAFEAAAGELFAAHHGPGSIEFLKAHPTLMIDTRHFSADFTDRLLSALGDIDEQTDGVLVHSENFQALNLMQRKYRQKIKCVYIDPPYNSKTTEILYKNDYKHSSWLSLMDNRLMLSKFLASADGSHIIAIDENEQEVLGRLISNHFQNHEKICIAIIHNKKGIQGNYFSFNHDYAYFCIPSELSEAHGKSLEKSEWEYSNLRKWGRESERETARNCFYPIYVEGDQIVGFGKVCDDSFHPGKSNIIENKDNNRIAVYPVDSQGIERKWRYARQSIESIKHLLKVNVTTSGEIQILKAKSEIQPKTVWDDSRYIAGDYGTKWLTDLGIKIKDDLYPKSIYTVMDSILAVSDIESFTLDFFAGSGTTGHAVINLNREDGGRRKFILVEMADYFDTVLLPRLKKVIFTPEWKDGAPKRLATPEEAERSPRMFKIVRLESYEDTLNNLELRRTKEQEDVLFSSEAQGPNGFKEQYLLHYMLDVESRGSQSLLNIEAFDDPMAYQLKVKRPGSDESSMTTVDLIETFNWLLGLTVQHVAAPQAFNARFVRSSEGRLELEGGRLQQHAQGRWWFRTVEGTTPDGRKTLVIWRNLTDSIEQSNLVLDTWFSTQGYSSKDSEFDLIYVNGTNNLENLRLPDATWKVRLIEEDFKRLMFESEEGI